MGASLLIDACDLVSFFQTNDGLLRPDTIVPSIENQHILEMWNIKSYLNNSR